MNRPVRLRKRRACLPDFGVSFSHFRTGNLWHLPEPCFSIILFAKEMSSLNEPLATSLQLLNRNS